MSPPNCVCSAVYGNNADLLQIKEIDNSVIPPPNGVALTNYEFESYICEQLVKEIQPIDLDTDFSDVSNSLSILDVNSRNFLITNNESIITSELVSIKTEYETLPNNGILADYTSVSTNNESGSAVISSIYNDISNSFPTANCNIKIDVRVNQDDQLSLPSENAADWSVAYDRDPGMNYFSLINSPSQNNGNYPLYIQAENNNDKCCGYQPNYYFTSNSNNLVDNSGTLNAIELDYANKITNDYDYNVYPNNASETFGSYEVVQDTPSTLASSSTNFSDLPYKYNLNSTVLDLNSDIFDTSYVWQSTDGMQSGYTLTLTVGENESGGYSLDGNPTLYLDQTQLNQAYDNSYAQIPNLYNITHYVEITSGTVDLSNTILTSTNTNYISLTDSSETLDASYNLTSGNINIYVKPPSKRVYYADGENNTLFDPSSNTGTKSSLTECVDVNYTVGDLSGSETNTIFSDYANPLDSPYATTDAPSFYLEVEVPASTWSNTYGYAADTRNIASNNNAVLVLAETSGANLYINRTDFSFNCFISDSDATNEVDIISITCNSILTEETALTDPSGLEIPFSSSTVTITNIDISGLAYDNYEVLLTTKTIYDISDSLQLTGNWSVTTSNLTDSVTIQDTVFPSDASGYIIGTPLKTGAIYDDYMFMTLDNRMDVSMTYEFIVDGPQNSWGTPVFSDLQAIKHAVKLTFYDINTNDSELDVSGTPIYNTEQSFVYLDDSEITYSNISYTDICMNTVTGVSLINMSLPNSIIHRFGSANTYTFAERRQTKTYNASFDSKFPLYENVVFQTPEITEVITYYAAYDAAGVLLPSYVLKYFTNGVDDLAQVYVELSEPIKTEFVLTQDLLSIFKSTIYASYNGDESVIISNTASIDPFFNLKQLLNVTVNASQAEATLKIHVFNDPQNIYNYTYIDKPYYKILLNNAPGANVSYGASLITYNSQYNSNAFDGFNPYSVFSDVNNYYGEPYTFTDLVTEYVINNANTNTLNIYDVSENLLASIAVNNTNTYLVNLNVIKNIYPLFKVQASNGAHTMDNGPDSTAYMWGNNAQQLEVDYGIYYYYIGNSALYTFENGYSSLNDTFTLVTDSFKLEFVNDVTFPNNNSAYNTDPVLFYNELIQNSLENTANLYYNRTKGVVFSLVRGYYSLPGGNGVDNIIIKRTGTTFEFGLGSPVNATQIFTNVAYGSNLLLDNVSSYNLGLILSATQSILSSTDNTYYEIYVTVADYYLESNGQTIVSGYLSDTNNLLHYQDYPGIDGVFATSIFVTTPTVLTVTYTVPDLVVNYSTEYIGNPALQSYSSYTSYQYNDIVNNYQTIGPAEFQKVSNIVFYEPSIYYYVVSPPVVSVYGIPYSNIYNSVPISDDSSYFISFHILDNSTYPTYVIPSNLLLPDNSRITFKEIVFKQTSTKNYSDYVSTDVAYSPINIKGNYVTVSLFSGLPSPPVNDATLAAHDSTRTAFDILYDGLIDDINLDPVHYTVTQDADLNWKIAYYQKISNDYWTADSPNIYFTVGTNFTQPNLTGDNSYYLPFKVAQATRVVMYQTTINYISPFDSSNTDISGVYTLTIDKYTSVDTDYNNLFSTNPNLRYLTFELDGHYQKVFDISATDVSGDIIPQADIQVLITMSDISNQFPWVDDLSFNGADSGLSFQMLNQNGSSTLHDFFVYDNTANIRNKALYIQRKDFINLKNIIGQKIYRVTSDGITYTPQVTTNLISLYY